MHENTPAPPAIVPKRYGLISMTFFTVPDAGQRISMNQPDSIKKTTYVASCSSTRVNSYDNSALKPESKGGSAMLNLDLAVGVGMIIGVKPQERSGLKWSI